MKKSAQKETLLIVATHGNETIGIETVKLLERDGYNTYFDVLVGNPRALKIGSRYVEADLNRSYPGDPRSSFYEVRKAYRNTRTAKKYRYIIDLHEASSGTDDFVIIPREVIATSFPLELIDLSKVLLWPEPKGPLGQILENCIELEFGTKQRNRASVTNKASAILRKFFDRLAAEKNTLFSENKEVYTVYGKLLAEEPFAPLQDLKDFKEVQVGNEVFYPLLVGQYINDGILCYKMKRL